MKAYKKGIRVPFSRYEKCGIEETKEGNAPYKTGDYRMVGVEGEVWCMNKEVFEKNYKVIKEGLAEKVKVIVDFEFAEKKQLVLTAWGALLTALEGDAIVSAGEDDCWVVSRSIFDKTYEIIK